MRLPIDHFPSVKYLCPACPNCGTSMMLARIDWETTELDRRTFECVPCDRSDTSIITRAL